MKKLIFLIPIIFFGCQEEDANTIRGRLVDRYTQEPIEGLHLNNGTRTLYSEMKFFVYNLNYGGGPSHGLTKEEIVKK